MRRNLPRQREVGDTLRDRGPILGRLGLEYVQPVGVSQLVFGSYHNESILGYEDRRRRVGVHRTNLAQSVDADATGRNNGHRDQCDEPKRRRQRWHPQRDFGAAACCVWVGGVGNGCVRMVRGFRPGLCYILDKPIDVRDDDRA